MEAGKSQNKIKAYLLCSEMKGCQCIPPPCLPCISGSFKLGYVDGWKDCYAEADASNPLAFIDTPSPKNRWFSSFRLSGFPSALVLSACRHTKMTTKFHFSFFHFSQNPGTRLYHGFAAPYTNYAKYQFSVITFALSSVMQSYQGFEGFRQSPGIVLRLRRLPAAFRVAAVPLY